MPIETVEEVTPAVLAAMARTEDPRFKEIITALVRHLHAFAQDVKLTEPEWERAIGYLVALGQKTNDTHNEAILASDSIGLSTLVCLMNNGASGNTETAAALARAVLAHEIDRARKTAARSCARKHRGPRSLSRQKFATPPTSRLPARRSMSGRRLRSACTRTRTRRRPT